MNDLTQRLRDQQPNAKNSATEYNVLWDEAADRIDELESEANDDAETNQSLRDRIKRIEEGRLLWLKCECCCQACKAFDALLRGKEG